jgi:hypothetical protein
MSANTVVGIVEFVAGAALAVALLAILVPKVRKCLSRPPRWLP